MRRTVLASLILVTIAPCLTIAKYSGGSGETNDPYQIATAEDLNDIGNHPEDFNKCFLQTTDINLATYTGTQFKIIGSFSGVFDGNGHSISNFTYQSSSAAYIGLFGYVTTSYAQLKNMILVDPNINGGKVSYVGALVGKLSDAFISNCGVKGGCVKGGDYIGGLCGRSYRGTIKNCYATASVKGISHLGGLCGLTDEGSISYCYATGTVIGEGPRLGGLCGHNEQSQIRNCYATGSVTATSGSFSLGGLCGSSDSGYIGDCYATGSVTGDYFIGGLCGNHSYGTISNCYATGNVIGGYESYGVGGLCGSGVDCTIISGYFLDTAGLNNGYGTPRRDWQMRQQNTFVGWDFNDIWHICESYNYPEFPWQKLPADIVCPDGVDFLDIEVLCEQWLFNEIPSDLVPLGGDGIVNFADFAVFADQWSVTNNINDLLDFAGQWLKEGIPYCSADIAPLPDGDGIVNLADFALMAGSWSTISATEATKPQPADHATNVSRNVILQWFPGQSCMSHHIFFGTDFNEVNDADINNTNVYMGNQVANYWDTNNYNSNGLDFNTTYYWRIDESAWGHTINGNVWSFTVTSLEKAKNPQPSDGQINVSPYIVLSWSAAMDADLHDVYFGTSYNDVNIAVHGSGEYKGNQVANTWDTNNYAPAGLNFDTTYYWRIDETAAGGYVTKGDVWSFTTFRAIAAWWKFDEGTGTIAYDSVGNNNGTVYGATWTTGKIAGALSFNGTSNYVDCGSGPSNYDNITVSAWMKTSTEGVVVSNRYGSWGYGTWYTLSSTSIAIGDNSQGGYRYLNFNATTLDGLWHHVVYTKNGTNHAIYVDGSLDQEFTSNADISQNVPTFIGRKWTNSSGVAWFNGVIDDVRIYNRALTAEEVNQIYQSGL
jgi:hypothetical protein